MSNKCQFKLLVLHNNNPNYIVIWLWLTFTLLMNNSQGDEKLIIFQSRIPKIFMLLTTFNSILMKDDRNIGINWAKYFVYTVSFLKSLKLMLVIKPL